MVLIPNHILFANYHCGIVTVSLLLVFRLFIFSFSSKRLFVSYILLHKFQHATTCVWHNLTVLSCKNSQNLTNFDDFVSGSWFSSHTTLSQLHSTAHFSRQTLGFFVISPTKNSNFNFHLRHSKTSQIQAESMFVVLASTASFISNRVFRSQIIWVTSFRVFVLVRWMLQHFLIISLFIFSSLSSVIGGFLHAPSRNCLLKNVSSSLVCIVFVTRVFWRWNCSNV